MAAPYLLHHLLERAAEQRGQHVAVVDRDRSLTYGELDRRANQLANLLLDLGVARGDRVGLYLDKSIESVVAVYGVLKAGAAYVPLDPHAPVARLRYIVQNCGVRVLVTGGEKASSWPGLLGEAATLQTLVVLRGPSSTPAGPEGLRLLAPGAVEASATSRPAVAAIDLDLAYILYTSGSTGVPKGVMLTHLNGLRFVEWAADEVGVGPDDRLSSHAPLHFDLSTFDLFAAAMAGAAVVLVPHETSVFPVEVARFIEDRAITVWYSVPSILTLLTQRAKLQVGAFPQLRTVLFAGEVFPTPYLRRLMSLLPHVTFCNLYGPTETNVCTYYWVPPLPEGDDNTIPIGRAIANVEVFAMTDDGRRASPGEVGELYVRGATVMKGYWGDPDRTSRLLVPDPRGGERPDLVYRTGDLVQERSDGNYSFLGRRDDQIKSRGYRIELGDIETALYAHRAVDECAVVAVPDDLVTNRIKAYVVASGPVSPADLSRFCAERLPRYMIPEEFEFREELPKTSTGKVDRRALANSVRPRPSTS